MTILRIPTSQDGILPCTLTSVSEQQRAIDTAKADATRTQKAAVRLTASVGVVFAGALDAITHTAFLLIIPIPLAIKVTVAKWTGLDKYMSAAFDGKEWVGHAKKIGACIVLIVKGTVFGVYNPNIVIDTGLAWTLFVPKPKADGQARGGSGAAATGAQVSGAPVTGATATGTQVVPPGTSVDTVAPATVVTSDAKKVPAQVKM